MKRLPALLALAALLLTGCGYATVENDEIGVHRAGSLILPEDPVIQKGCLKPGTNPRVGLGDKALLYPAGQRTYKIGTGHGQDMPGIPVITKDGAQMTMTGVISFYLNHDCKTLRAFHKNIGAKDWGGYPAYVNDGYTGWSNMLDVYIGQQAINVVNDIAGGYESEALYKDPKIRAKLQKPIQDALPGAVKSFSHGNYFTRFTVRLNQPHAPHDLVEAYNSKVAAVQENLAQAAKNTKAATQLDQITACLKQGLSESTCAFIYAVNTGAVTAVPQGGVVLPKR